MGKAEKSSREGHYDSYLASASIHSTTISYPNRVVKPEAHWLNEQL